MSIKYCKPLYPSLHGRDLTEGKPESLKFLLVAIES